MQINFGQRRPERGNILFLILLAVVLFAALSNAVTQSIRGGGKDASTEGAQTTAAVIMQRMANTSAGIQRFLLTSGYTLETIDLKFTGAPHGAGDASTCTVDACNLYDPAGGNVTVPLLPKGSQLSDQSTIAASCPINYFNSDGTIKPFAMIIGVKDVGTSLPELVLYYCGVKKSVCDALNAATLNDSTVSTLFWNFGGFGTFAGGTNPLPVTTANQIGGVSPNDNRLAGATTFCVDAAGPTSYSLFHVLVAR